MRYVCQVPGGLLSSEALQALIAAAALPEGVSLLLCLCIYLLNDDVVQVMRK